MYFEHENVDTKQLELHCETLEFRRLLAGTVQVERTGQNDIIVTGDDQDNQIEITVNDDSLLFRGNDGTAFVFIDDPDFSSTEIRDIRIDMGSGDDTLELSGNASIRDLHFDQRGEDTDSRNDFQINELSIRNVRLFGGDGASSRLRLDSMSVEDIRVDGSNSFMNVDLDTTEVDGNIRLNGRNRPNRFSLGVGSSVSGNVRLNFGEDEGFISINDSSISGRTDIRTGNNDNIFDRESISLSNSQLGQLRLRNGIGMADVEIVRTSIDGTLRIDLGEGEDELRLDELAQLSGDTTIRMGDGNDVINNEEASVGNFFSGNVSVDLGEGQNLLRIEEPTNDGAFFVSGRLTINGGNDTDAAEIGPGFGQANIGSLRMNLGAGADEIIFAGVRFEGPTRISTGDGADEVSILDGDRLNSTTLGLVRIDTGSGNDQVRIDDIDNRGGMQVNTGSGQDQVELEDVSSVGGLGFVDVSVNLGAGDDVIVAANFDIANPFFVSGGRGFDTLVMSSNQNFREDAVSQIESIRVMKS